MAHCHKLCRIGRVFHCSLSFTVIEHRSSTDKHDDPSNGLASYLFVSVVRIHKHSNCHLVNQWWREIVVNLLYILRVLLLEVSHKFRMTTQVSSCDNGVPRIHHYPFIWVLFQVAKYPQGTAEVPFPGAGSEAR